MEQVAWAGGLWGSFLPLSSSLISVAAGHIGRQGAPNETDGREREREGLGGAALTDADRVCAPPLTPRRGGCRLHVDDCEYADVEDYTILSVKEIFQIHGRVYRIGEHPHTPI